MKKFLMLIVMVCLAGLLGFPKPVIASNLQYTLSGLERNHQAIGRAIPGLHTLERLPYPLYLEADVCSDSTWFLDKTISLKAKYNNGLTPRTCSSYHNFSWPTNLFKKSKSAIRTYPAHNSDSGASLGRKASGYLKNRDGIDEMRGLIRETLGIPPEEKHLGRYFSKQYPEFAILGASELRENFRYFNTVSMENYLGITKRQKFQVDGTTAVIWEQQIPDNSVSNLFPTVHHLLIVENSSISDIDMFPKLQKKGNYQSQYNRIFGKHTLTDRVEQRNPYRGVSLFDSFYYLIFASDIPLTQNVIENVVHSITTGTAPAPYSPNPNFSFPTLKENQTTNLPIDVSTAFNPPIPYGKCYINTGVNLPTGLTFDQQTNSIIVDTSSGLQPPGPKNPRTSTGSVNYPVKINVLDNNKKTITSHTWNLTVNP